MLRHSAQAIASKLVTMKQETARRDAVMRRVDVHQEPCVKVWAQQTVYCYDNALVKIVIIYLKPK